MCFGLSLRGSQSFWNRFRGEVSDMIIQQGSPTYFFTLSVVDTKWHDLHMAMHSNPLSNAHDQTRWRMQNIVANQHHASQYIHCGFNNILKRGPTKRITCKGIFVQVLVYLIGLTKQALVLPNLYSIHMSLRGTIVPSMTEIQDSTTQQFVIPASLQKIKYSCPTTSKTMRNL